METTQMQSTADKIRGLLNKAKATNFPEEANAFLSKAAEMMAKYSITEAMLADARTDPIEEEIITLGKYQVQKVNTLVSIVQAFGCHAVDLRYSKGRGTYGVVGFRSDLNMVKALMESLEIQLDRELLNVTGDGWVTTKSARTSFAHSWCTEVARRITNFYAAAVEEAEQEATASGSTSTALVLASRDEQVSNVYEEKYGRKPRYSSRQSSHTHHGGYASRGRKAGQRADIGTGSLRSNRGALTS